MLGSCGSQQALKRVLSLPCIQQQQRCFGLINMKAWVKRATKQKIEKDEQLKLQNEIAKQLSREWQSNELLDATEPIKIPNISLLYHNDASKIENVVKAIDNESEDDISILHPYSIYSLFVIERLPIINRISDYRDEYNSALRKVKLGQNMPNLFRELYIDKIQKEERENDKENKIRPKITVDDINNEIHSLNRCLDKRLYLLCQIKDREYWEFPWAQRLYDETLMETAQRALEERVGNYLHYSTVTQEPFGHKQYNYDKEKDGKIGAQVFFQKGYYLSGNGRLDETEICNDFGWFPKNEIKTKINPVLWESIHELLLE